MCSHSFTDNGPWQISRYCGVNEETRFALCLAHSRYIISDKQTRQMSRSVARARQNPCLALSRSVLALKVAFWPESGAILAQEGHKFSYGVLSGHPWGMSKRPFNTGWLSNTGCKENISNKDSAEKTLDLKLEALIFGVLMIWKNKQWNQLLHLTCYIIWNCMNK